MLTSYHGYYGACARYIEDFSGAENDDVCMWLKKLKMVATLKKVDDLSNFIPLYLEGPAFSVYDQISEEDRENPEEIERVLLGAFAQNAFSANDSLRQRSWCPGESVDVYLADIRRLAKLAGVESDFLVRCAFIHLRSRPQDIVVDP